MLHVHVVMIFLDIFMHVTLETELIWAMLINQNFFRYTTHHLPFIDFR